MQTDISKNVAQQVSKRMPAVESPLTDFFRKFRRQRAGVFASIVVGMLVLVACIGPYIAPYDPTAPDYDAILAQPSAEHWAGTDQFGRDILSRIIYGARISLSVGLISVFTGAMIGIFFGLTCGYYGGKYDSLVMRACDILLAFPGILLAIAVVAILGPGLFNVIVAVAIFTIPVFIRIVRGNTLVLKNMTYIEAARAMGIRDFTIIAKHIFPGTLSVVSVYFTMTTGTAILIASSLSFLGISGDPSLPEWGAMLSSSRDFLATASHVVLFPGLAIFITCLSFNLLGDAIRDALDRKIKD